MSSMSVRTLQAIPRLATRAPRAGPSSSARALHTRRRARIVVQNAARQATTPSTIQRISQCSMRHASSSASISPTDPTLDKAYDLVESGTRELEEGDLEGAKKLYQESLGVKETASGWFNLGVCEYHLKNISAAIEAWEKSIAITPSADAYTNLASAFVLAQPPQPALAIKHLTSALELESDDPEIAFNLAAVLESIDNLETALKMYERAHKGGIERAAQNIRNVGAKILAKKAKEASAQS